MPRQLFAKNERREPLDGLFDLANLKGKALVPAAELAHGEKQWLEIAMLMAMRPRSHSAR